MKTLKKSPWNNGLGILPSLAIGMMALLLTLVFVSFPNVQEGVMGFLFNRDGKFTEPLVFPRASLLTMTLDHLFLAGIAAALSLSLGLLLGIFLTRSIGQSFQKIILNLSALIQTLPPLAVIILIYPLVGFGITPTIYALVFYSVFPVISNTVTGITNINPSIREAALGMGYSGSKLFFEIEWPLALPVILTGIRYSIILSVGTATIGPLIGSGGLGRIIVSGMRRFNPAYVLTGAIVISLMAIILDMVFEILLKLTTQKMNLAKPDFK
jgi:osmoprotectant transport system permease protein